MAKLKGLDKTTNSAETTFTQENYNKLMDVVRDLAINGNKDAEKLWNREKRRSNAKKLNKKNF